MIKRLKRMFVKKQEKYDYFWVGIGENPLKEHGIKDLIEHN